MSTKRVTEIVSEIVELLTPIESDERIRVVQASLMLLGESLPANKRAAGSSNTESGDEGASIGIPARAQSWMKQNDVGVEQLQQIFHFENGSVEVIAGDMPGKNKKEKTLNAYVLGGLAGFLATGDPLIVDKPARALCKRFGCYDEANHASTIYDRGNVFTGSKDKGWTLTAPGLKRAAELVKEAANA